MHEEFLNKLNWRYATKRFDTNKKLTEQQLDYLINAVNYAPTSYGIQPFELYVAGEGYIRKQLIESANGQVQALEASHLFIFAVKMDITPEDISEFALLTGEKRNLETSSSDRFRDMLISSIGSKSVEQKFIWASRQAYIALGFLLSAAAIGGIDACPMEGFDRDGFDEILGLKEKGLASVVMAATGFRSPDDKYATLAKVRKPLEKLVTRV